MKRPIVLYMLVALQCLICIGLFAVMQTMRAEADQTREVLSSLIDQHQEEDAAVSVNPSESQTKPTSQQTCRDSEFTLTETNKDPNGDGTCKILTTEITYRRKLCHKPYSDTAEAMSQRMIGPYLGPCSDRSAQAESIAIPKDELASDASESGA